MEPVVIGIIGAGSIGSLFGGYLASISEDIYPVEVIFFCRKEHSEEIRRHGLKLHTSEEILKIEEIKSYHDTEIIKSRMEANPEFQFDFMFLTTKAYDMTTALEEYKSILNVTKYLVILQNGIGNEEIVEEYFPKNRIIRIVTSNGALMAESGHVIHTGQGFTKMGLPYMDDLYQEERELKAAREYLRLLSDLLNLAGIEAEIKDDIVKECWEKVFVNIGINAFGALTRQKNGKLLENEILVKNMEQAVREAVEIATMKGIVLPKRDYVSVMLDVAKKTAENQNSMLQDVLRGKRTEIDFINGKIVKIARELNIKVPVNDLLTCLMKSLEESYL